MEKGSSQNARTTPVQRPERIRAKQAKKLMIEILKKYPIVEAACAKVGVSRSTHYEWTKKDLQYAADVEDAMRLSVDTVTDIAESNVIEKVKQGDFKASTFWLTNRHQKYKPKSKLEAENIEQLVMKPVPSEDTVARIRKYNPDYRPPTKEEYITKEEWDRQCKSTIDLAAEAARRLRKSDPE